MAKFYVKCGTTLDADTKFCDTCGEPVRAPGSVQTAPATARSQAVPSARRPGASQTPEVNWRKLSLWSGASLAALVVLGGVVAVLTMPPATPGAADIETILNANPAQVVQVICLGNFAYEKNPVLVSGFDAGTQQWMAVLSSAGIYTEPQPAANGPVFGGSLQYSHTAEGEKKIHNGKLCFADGLTVVSVQFAKPVKRGKQWRTQGIYRYGYRHADAWTQKPEALRLMPEHFADLPKTGSIALVKGEHGWEPDRGYIAGDAANNNALNSIVGGLAQRALQRAVQGDTDDEASERPGPFGGLSAAISRWFGGFASNTALVGKWRGDNDAYGTFEFTRDSATLQGNAVAVTYEKDKVDDNRIRVKTRSGATLASIVLVDNDHFYIDLPFDRVRFHRVN
jgi:hypothetical protein